MYCEDSEGTDIDHFHPKSAFPARAFDWTNYLLGCSRCNSNFKRNQFPVDPAGNPLLIDPTRDDPTVHLLLVPDTGDFVPLTPKGVESIRVFGLDRQTLQLGRRNAWTTLNVLLEKFADAKRTLDVGQAGAIETAVRQHPFSSTLVHLLAISRKPGSGTALPPETEAALLAAPEIRTWAP